jgi:hypothetical protein
MSNESKSKALRCDHLIYFLNDVLEGVWECDSDIKNDVRFNICSLCLHMHMYLLRALVRGW